MEVRYLNEAEWQTFMEQRKREERAIDIKIASGELDPESIFSFGRELAKRTTVRVDLNILRTIKL